MSTSTRMHAPGLDLGHSRPFMDWHVPRMLVVEAQGTLSKVLSTEVFKEPYLVDSARDASSAVALAGYERYDLIVVNLAGDKGIALCRALRANACLTPIVLLGLSARQEEIIAALSDGADEYLAGTVHLDELRARLRALYRRYRYCERVRSGPDPLARYRGSGV